MGLGEISKSLTDYIKTKCTNPFFGTLFFVWIIFHWKLIYIVFSFEKGTSLEDKVNFISHFLDEPSFICNMGWCILISFGVLIASYILTNAARFITEFSNEIVNPKVFNKINKISNKANTISKVRYKKIQEDRDYYKDRYEEEREYKLRAEKARDEMEDKYKNAIKFDENKRESKLRTEQEKMKEDYNKAETNEPIFDENIIQLYYKIKRDGKLEDFIKIKEIINNNKYISYFEGICNYFLKNKIIQVFDSIHNGTMDYKTSYKYTETGKKLIKYHQQMLN